MSTVTITGFAWDHQGKPIPANRHPELLFRPKASAAGSNGLLAAVEATANLNPSTGAFTVAVESEPGIYYQPVMRWVSNWAENDPAQWAFEYTEWDFLVTPGGGGPISDLVNKFPPGAILAALGPPPSSIENIVWIDLLNQTEKGALVYAPVGSV